MTIDTNKAREYAQALNFFAGTRSDGEAKIEVDSAALLLALADAHDSMAKALEGLLVERSGMPKECGHFYECRCAVDAARAAMGADNG